MWARRQASVLQKPHSCALYCAVSGSLDVHQKEQGHTQLATWACKVTETECYRERMCLEASVCVWAAVIRVLQNWSSLQSAEREQQYSHWDWLTQACQSMRGNDGGLLSQVKGHQLQGPCSPAIGRPRCYSHSEWCCFSCYFCDSIINA